MCCCVGCGKPAVALREADPGTANKRQQCMATLPPAGEASLRRIRLLTLQICGKCIGGGVSRMVCYAPDFGTAGNKLVLKLIQMVHDATQLVMPGLDPGIPASVTGAAVRGRDLDGRDKPGHPHNVNHVFVSKH
jgi:hypothetical protein